MTIATLFTSANPLTKAHIAILKSAVKALNIQIGCLTGSFQTTE